ncbi:MAG TPA: hypothetical protein VFN44_12185 [Solirubrobacteraceae bacterium]|nr:hypothetical protein [Solirubrobacteraceae bacterium]
MARRVRRGRGRRAGGVTLLAIFREAGAALDRALRHVATAVAANVEPAEVFELVAGTARELLDVDSAAVVRYEGPTHGRVMGQDGGLVAGEIPDGAAILGVADAYDAMTVARPYSAPLLTGGALEEAAGSPAGSSTRTPSRRSRRCWPSARGAATRAAGARAAPEARR